MRTSMHGAHIYAERERHGAHVHCMEHVHGAHACSCWWTQRACACGVCEGWLPPRLVPRDLILYDNAISVLPAGIFDQLTSLTWVREGGRVYGAMGEGEGICGSMCGLVWSVSCVCGLYVCTCLYWHGYSDAYFIIHVCVISKWRGGSLGNFSFRSCHGYPLFVKWKVENSLCAILLTAHVRMMSKLIVVVVVYVWESLVCWHWIE